MDGTIILQGSFISDGFPKYIPLRCGVDWMRVTNWTNSIGATAAAGTSFYWQRDMPTGRGLVYPHVGAAATIGVQQIPANVGFTLYDTSVDTAGVQRAVVTSTVAAQPVVEVAADPRLVMRDNVSIVRMESTLTSPTLSGVDFVVTAMDATHFTLPVLANVVPAAGASFYRIIPYQPMFYPRNRTVCNVSQAVNAVVTTTVPHEMTVGQQVRFNVPAYGARGMVQLHNVLATVLTVVDPGAGIPPTQFTIDIDTTAFTVFAWPIAADAPCQYPQMIPVGVAARHPYENLLEDATLNVSQIGMILGTSTDAATALLSPGGTAADVIYWVAGKSWNM